MSHLFCRKMAEIEIIPADGSDRGNIPRFTLKIVTEQTHATELVEMLTCIGHSIKAPDHHSNPSVSAVPADSDSDTDYCDALQHLWTNKASCFVLKDEEFVHDNLPVSHTRHPRIKCMSEKACTDRFCSCLIG